MHKQVAARTELKNINDEIAIQTKELKDRTLEFDKAVNEEYVLNTEYLKENSEWVSINSSHFIMDFTG